MEGRQPLSPGRKMPLADEIHGNHIRAACERLVSGLAEADFCPREGIWGGVAFPEDGLHCPSCLGCPGPHLWLDPTHLGEVAFSAWINGPCSYQVHSQT